MSTHAAAFTSFASSLRARHEPTPAAVRRARYALVRHVAPLDARSSPRSWTTLALSPTRVSHTWAPRITLHLGRLEHTLVERSNRIVHALPPHGEAPWTRKGAPALRIASAVVRREALAPDTLARRLVQSRAQGVEEPAPAPLLRRVERIVARSAAAVASLRPPPAPSRPAPLPTPAMSGGHDTAFSERDVARLTDSVVRSIEQRIRAQRERMGRA